MIYKRLPHEDLNLGPHSDTSPMSLCAFMFKSETHTHLLLEHTAGGLLSLFTSSVGKDSSPVSDVNVH